jgi:predicted amidophosphoribosyltransferase
MDGVAMIVICPTCRAPTNTTETHCWVCRREFDGSEPVIGDLPGMRGPLRLSDVRDVQSRAGRLDRAPPWRNVRAG